MKIIFNSDLLYADSFIVGKLPRNLHEFLVKCKEHGHEIIIPETTLLEFDRKQKEFLEKEIAELASAKYKLSFYGLNVKDFDPSDIVPRPDLLDLIQNIIPCVVEYPTKNDYCFAHRKACLRELPHPPEIQSDEMRDLVIWEISLRVSRETDGALLMSRDKVHTHHRGDLEAHDSLLIRSSSFERAYDSLSIQTDSAKKVKSLLNKVWEEILNSELPLVNGCHIVAITSIFFEDSLDGTSQFECLIKLKTGDGKEFNSRLDVQYWEDISYILRFHDAKVGEFNLDDVIINLDKPENIQGDVNDRRESLELIMRG